MLLPTPVTRMDRNTEAEVTSAIIPFDQRHQVREAPLLRWQLFPSLGAAFFPCSYTCQSETYGQEMAAFVAGGDFLPPQSETYGQRGAFSPEAADFLCDSPPSSLLIPI